MAIKPILFNTEMVQAVLAGRKTVTRRLIKPQPQSKLCYIFAGCDVGTWRYPSKTAHESWGEEYRLPDSIAKEELTRRWNPPYHTEDILYVRETWERFECWNCEGDERGNCPKEPQKSVLDKTCGCYMYRAANEISGDAKWRPSIHMPKEAARIWLKVTDVRVERLQEITEEQACMEGTNPLDEACYENNGWHPTFSDPDSGGEPNMVDGFHKLWNSTIKKSDLDMYGWNANPWVWVIEFERCEKPKI